MRPLLTGYDRISPVCFCISAIPTDAKVLLSPDITRLLYKYQITTFRGFFECCSTLLRLRFEKTALLSKDPRRKVEDQWEINKKNKNA
jgi:hypothetical protein